MMLKIVYGSPPADEERIEDFEPEGRTAFRKMSQTDFSVGCFLDVKTSREWRVIGWLLASGNAVPDCVLSIEIREG